MQSTRGPNSSSMVRSTSSSARRTSSRSFSTNPLGEPDSGQIQPTHFQGGPTVTKQLIFDETARRHLKRGVDRLSDAVKVTLGLKGRNVVLDKKFGSPTITNDGVTIARDIELDDPFENMGAQLLKEVATKTDDVAGDGTTTAVVLAQAMVSEGLRNVTAGANPMGVKRGIEKGVEAIVAELKKNSRPVEDRAQI